MLMEPDEFHATAIVPSASSFFRSSEEFRPLVTEYVHLHRPSQPRARSIDDSQNQGGQNYFPPPFFRNGPPLGHSRPYFSSHEGHANRFGAGRSFDQAILGSGDFGVIRGGTFYQDDDPPPRSTFDSDELYFNNNNGHGRPHATPFAPKAFYPDDQFANFRDFADINTPTDPAYSQFVVVYANKNSTEPHPNPKNIFEQLELLDKEKNDDEQKKQKKNSISKFKKKLANTKLEKKYKKKVPPKEQSFGDFEPLLALS